MNVQPVNCKGIINKEVMKDLYLSKGFEGADLEFSKGFVVGTMEILGEMVALSNPNGFCGVSKILKALSPKERVFALEKMIADSPLSFPGCVLPVRNCISGGMYMREMFLPAGIVATGAIHKQDHFCFVDGDVSVYDGYNGLMRYSGSHSFSSPAGIKRAGYAHKDTFFTTIHRMSNPFETDISKLEMEFMTNSYKLLEVA